MKKPHYYQTEADDAIHEELLINDKCIVKMFCGTGKSLIMRRCKTIEDKKLVVFVFPSLSLIRQFYEEYLNDYNAENILQISSEDDATTNPIEITQFLSKINNKIICITYHSFKTLLDNLGEIIIDVCIFDEAHHAVGETYQKSIFENKVCDKQIFFTATPKNANGIIMYDREQPDDGVCGNLVYDYSCLRGIDEDYLNPFEIRIDMFTENTNKSVFESIARAILSTGNSRVLTFHSDVNTDRDTSVMNFVDNTTFKAVFKQIQKTEFPLIKKYTKVNMIELPSSVKPKQRDEILKKFDKTDDDEIMIISSCETIGEGIDTKNANMCVFVDPKSSPVKIIQNIGRIVRKPFGIDKPKSTILIPCWVDKSKYLECGNDKEECDAVIRQDMSVDGNFNGILNVLSALKQEDEDLYDICLHYPNTYSPKEIRNNLLKQGYTILEPIGDGGLVENIGFLLDNDVENDVYRDCETDEDRIMCIASDSAICVEIHTNSLETPIEKYNSECDSGEIVRLYLNADDVNKPYYQPIVKNTGKKKNKNKLNAPKQRNKKCINVHTNPDVKVLWNISSDVDITTDICSCVIDCQVSWNKASWHTNLAKVITYMDKEKKRPSEKNKLDEVKFMGHWVSNQKYNYNKNTYIMKKPAIRKEWEDVLVKYKEYLKQDIIICEISTDDTSITQDTLPPKPKKSMKLKIKAPIQVETTKQKRERVITEISLLHKRYKTMRSDNLHNEFNEKDNDLWKKYHEISEENEKSFPEEEIPRNRIIAELNKCKPSRTKTVVDMGCGKGQISQHFQNDKRFDFINYDHISSGDNIISCDISKTPLEDNLADICILSLAMWGSNCKEYIKEANRILESGGKLYIIEPTKRWSEKDENGNIMEEKGGTKMKSLLETSGFHIVEQSIEKFCMFYCMKNN